MAGIKLIIDEEAVRTRYALPELADITTAIESGLTAAHAAFQGALGTAFEENLSLNDVFYLDTNIHYAQPNRQFRLRLKQAFVMPGSVSIVCADSRVDCLGVDAEAVESQYVYVDCEKGLVYVDAGVGYDDKYLAVTYSAGFGTTTGVKAPEWLKEAVLAWMPSAFLASSYTSDPTKGLAQARSIQSTALSMIDGHKRETSLQVLPIY